MVEENLVFDNSKLDLRPNGLEKKRMWWLIGIAVLLYVLSNYIHKFVVVVPEVTGLVTVDLVGGGMKSYGTGIHLILWPIEQVREGNFINLRIVLSSFEETYPTKNGALMKAKISFQYVAELEVLTTYIKVSEEVILKGLKDVASSLMSIMVGKIENSEECKKEQENMENHLREKFDAMVPKPRELYGIKLIRVSIADFDADKIVQKVHEGEEKLKVLRRMAKDVTKDLPDIKDKDAMNVALIANGDIDKTVFEAEGEGGNAIAALLGALKGGKK